MGMFGRLWPSLVKFWLGGASYFLASTCQKVLIHHPQQYFDRVMPYHVTSTIVVSDVTLFGFPI
ncbi:hypothetical protein J6590_093417 [Homalodisca vitripennis]|nr:hypothetical protein J6590_093417 [Homalodisca vitripennis]